MTPKKAFLVMLGIVLLAIAISGAAYYYGDQQLVTRSEEISELQADLEAVNEQITVFEDSKAKTEKYSFVPELSAKILPDDKSQSELVAELKQFAVNQGISIDTISFDSGDAGIEDPRLTQTTALPDLAGVRVLGVAINFQSGGGIPYNSFLNFLRSVENNQRKMQVTDVSISPGDQDKSLLTSVTVNVNVFTKVN